MTNLDHVLKNKDITLLTKVRLVKAMVFPVVVYGCESWTAKKHWVLKNWCLWTVVLEKTLESPLDGKEIKIVNHKGNQSWIFIFESTEAEAEAPILWPPHAESQFIGKDPDAGKDWRQEEKGMTEDEIVGWYHWLNGHKFEQAPGDGGQGSLAYCSPWGHKESQRTWLEWVNNNDPYEDTSKILKLNYHAIQQCDCWLCILGKQKH